ncbi:MAG: 30S ribosome-binding factor RbfA [Actinomycetes bacterium]
MTDESPRARKLADRIKVIVASMLEMRVKDPRLGFVTVTDAYVTNDLREATVYYTVLGDGEAQTGTAIALESAKGLIRSEVGKQTGLRHTPSLEFIADEVPEHAREIEDLIAKAKRADAKVAARAAVGTYAGEPDPYRSAEPDDDDDDGVGPDA